MEKKRSPFTTVSPQQGSTKSPDKLSNKLPDNSPKSPSSSKSEKSSSPSSPLKPLKPPKKAKGYCITPPTSSGTQYFRRETHGDAFERIDSDRYVGLSESLSGSSSTFQCFHGPEGKPYTEKGLLKRNLIKELDPIPFDKSWTDSCPPAFGWDLAKMLEFLVTDPVGVNQEHRLQTQLSDLARISEKGYKIDVLESICTIVDYLVESYQKKPGLREPLGKLLLNMEKPVLFNAASDVITYFDTLQSYIGFLGYLLMRLEDEDLFSLVSNALLWQLSARDCARGPGCAHRRHVLAAAGSVLHQTTVRMLAVTDAHRFPTFLEVALLLACDNADNCIEMMKENIIENIFYRFNPYFPERKLPTYDINPADPQDFNVKLGDSSLNMSTTLSLLLVLVKTTREYLDQSKDSHFILPCPDVYSQRCFVWAYRYECRAREHQNERTTLTVIVAVLLHCFGDRLTAFSSLLMPDIMSLSVLTELPPRSDWLKSVNFNTGQLDVQFKKILINFSVDLIKIYPYNIFMIESRHWLLGLMYLIDPGLCYLRAHWSPALFAELRKTALQALVCTLPLAPPKLSQQYGLTRRIMWYIEWYSESPYELPVLYWCMRLLHVLVASRDLTDHRCALRDLFDSHGVIIIIHLCYTLLEQKSPPVEKGQSIIALCLRLLTHAVDLNKRLTCCVYPSIKWPTSINYLVKKIMDVVLFSLDKHFIVSDRWLVAFMNFIWEGIIWKAEYRAIFLANNGIYKLLDLITMSRREVQCIALALVCDVARAGDAVGQLVTWRATTGATHAHPLVVKRGATIAALLAAIFRDECRRTGVSLNEHGILQDLEAPLMSSEVKRMMQDPGFKTDNQRTAVCLAAADVAGSRLSKTFALLHMLSDDLDCIVSLADEAYNMYKNIKLSPEDEAVLVLCSHFFTVKLGEVWLETQVQCPGLLAQDHEVLTEFLHVGKGWAKEIKRQQEDVIEKDRKQEYDEEHSLYAFLARARLNVALDALREARCVARSADRARAAHAMLHDAVLAHHRRSVAAKKLDAPVLRTYGPSLDDQNITGQNVKIYSILPKDKPKPGEYTASS